MVRPLSMDAGSFAWRKLDIQSIENKFLFYSATRSVQILHSKLVIDEPQLST